MSRLKNRKAVIIAKEMVGMYMRYNVPRAAAALSYFLTLSLFPLLICLYSMLRQFIPDFAGVLQMLRGLIPQGTIDTLSDYLNYVVSHSSSGMFVAGVIVMVTSSSAAFRCLHSVYADMQGKSRYSGILGFLFSLLLSIIFLVLMYFAAIVIISGDWLLNFISGIWPRFNVVAAWKWVRFVLLFAVMLLSLFGIYSISAPRGMDRHLMTGAVVASVALVGISILFSWFIGMSTRYSLVYGSLASIVILMFWLYICGIVIIMGNVLNMVLNDVRVTEPLQEKLSAKKEPYDGSSPGGDVKNSTTPRA